MIKDNNHSITVSISVEALENKEIANAMTASAGESDVKEIRKRYGFKSTSGIGYRIQTVSVKEFYDLITSGHCFCNLMDVPQSALRKNGSFGQWLKRNCMFTGSTLVMLDIDKTRFKSCDTFVARLDKKPTLGNNSYSNNLPGKGARFRLIYVFDTLIPNVFLYKYVSDVVMKSVELDTGENVKDDCSLKASQYFNGNYHGGGFINGFIYSLKDFGISFSDYYDFLINKKAGYTTPLIDTIVTTYLNPVDYKKYSNEKFDIKSVFSVKKQESSFDACPSSLFYIGDTYEYKYFTKNGMHMYKEMMLIMNQNEQIAKTGHIDESLYKDNPQLVRIEATDTAFYVYKNEVLYEDEKKELFRKCDSRRQYVEDIKEAHKSHDRFAQNMGYSTMREMEKDLKCQEREHQVQLQKKADEEAQKVISSIIPNTTVGQPEKKKLLDLARINAVINDSKTNNHISNRAGYDYIKDDDNHSRFRLKKKNWRRAKVGKYIDINTLTDNELTEEMLKETRYFDKNVRHVSLGFVPCRSLNLDGSILSLCNKFGIDLQMIYAFATAESRSAAKKLVSRYGNTYELFFSNLYWYKNEKSQKRSPFFFRLPMTIYRKLDGTKRRKSIIARMCYRKVLRPGITANELLFNAMFDLVNGYEYSDIDIAKTLISSVLTVMLRTPEKIILSHCKKYRREIQRSVTKNGQIFRKREFLNSKNLEKVYSGMIDNSKSMAENIRILKENGLEVSDSTLYNYYKNNKRLSDKKLLELIDFKLSRNYNYHNIKKLGFKISYKRISKIFNSKVQVKKVSDNNNDSKLIKVRIIDYLKINNIDFNNINNEDYKEIDNIYNNFVIKKFINRHSDTPYSDWGKG